MPMKEKWLWRIRTSISITGLLIAILGAFKAYWFPTDNCWRLLNAIVWSFGPPIWLIVEYAYLYPWLDNDPAHKEDLKYGQGLAAAFWAGVGALLITVYTFRSPNPELDELHLIRAKVESIEAKLSAANEPP